MPIVKQVKVNQPLWKSWDQAAQKKGQHHTVYSVNGDHYTGEWNDNKKNGKGTKFWKKKGAVYDGDWKHDLRNGFGTYSLPAKEGGYKKVYSGGWKNDMKHGHGTYYYTTDKYYEGEWYQDKRSGWGRMYYTDGSVYEGEWFDDKRNGTGMERIANQNRYEGEWKDDQKHGEGKFYHLDKGQVFIGTWVNNIGKCGIMEDFNRNTAVSATKYPIPELKLLDSANVLRDAKDNVQSLY